jgi:RES domain-containing protein
LPASSAAWRTQAPPEPAAVSVTGRWFKQGPVGAPALPVRDPPPDNRWQRGSVVDALYLADSETTAWAEWYRHLAEAGVPPNHALPRALWRWEVEVDVADLRTAERLAALGLLPPSPGRRTWAGYQAVGERLWREGWSGLVAPSAARPQGLVLCLFRRGGVVSGARPIGRPLTIREPPVPPTGMTT